MLILFFNGFPSGNERRVFSPMATVCPLVVSRKNFISFFRWNMRSFFLPMPHLLSACNMAMSFISDGYWNLLVQGFKFVTDKLEVFFFEVVEVLYVRIDLQDRGFMLRLLNDFLDHIDVSVIDMGIGDDVDEFSGYKIADLGKHHQKDGILKDVPVVGCQHVVRSLVEDTVESVARDVEGH